MSSGAKIGLLFALIIVGVMGAYFAFGPGSDGVPPLQANASGETDTLPQPEAPRGEGFRPAEPPVRQPINAPAGVGEGPLTESVRQRAAETEQRPPFVIINRLPGDSSSHDDVHPIGTARAGAGSAGSPGTLTGTELPPIPPDDELPSNFSDGGKGGWMPPAPPENESDTPSSPPGEPASLPASSPRPDLPPARPPSGGMTDYIVRSGDNFWSIARMWFGEGSMHHLIAAANPGVESSKLRIGQTLKLPPKGDRASIDPPTDPLPTTNETYTVQPGDSLVSIARRLLNDDSKWKLLYETNRRLVGDDPDALKVGTVLSIPR